jgi:hypothetical protein
MFIGLFTPILLAGLYDVILNNCRGLRDLRFPNRKQQNKTSYAPRKARMFKLFSIVQHWSYTQRNFLSYTFTFRKRFYFVASDLKNIGHGNPDSNLESACISRSLVSSVCIAIRLRLETEESGFIACRVNRVSSLISVHTGSGAQPASYTMGMGGSFSGGEATGTRSRQLTSI